MAYFFSFSFLFFVLVCCAPAPAEYETEKHFFCDYLGVPSMEEGQNHSNQTFDRMFSYRQFSDGHYQFQLKIAGDWIPVKYKNDIIYHSHFDSAGKSFNIHRFNLKTSVLTRSHVYHVTPENYEKALAERQANPYLIPYDDRALPFSDDPLPKNHIKKSFDKSHWQCHEVSGLPYFIKKWGVLIMQILSAG